MTTLDAGAGLRTSASHRDSAAGRDRSRIWVIVSRSAVGRGLPIVAIVLVVMLLMLAIVASVAALPISRTS